MALCVLGSLVMHDTVTIAITFADDTVGVMTFITAERGDAGTVNWRRQATKDEVDIEIARCNVPAGKRPIKSWRPVDPHDLPKDRTYRNAWRDTGTGFAHDAEHVKRLKAQGY